jgi:hypothetical protein
MRKFILFILLSALSFPTLFASGTIPDGAIFSDDGTHWSKIDYDAEKNTLIVDGVLKATYNYISRSMYVGNTLFTTASDEKGISYLLKDGIVIEKAPTIEIISSYNNNDYTSKVEWWYTYDSGVFRVKNTEWKILTENMNAWTYSTASSLSPGIIQANLYNRNNEKPITYINGVSINGSISSIGTYKNGKKMEMIFLSTNITNISQIIAFDMASGKIRNLPSYDGVTQNATILDKKWNIKELQYVVMIWDMYAFADISGKLTSDSRYDEVIQLTSYGDKFFKSFIKDNKSYFFFDSKMYWAYDEIDPINISYKAPNYSIVSKWSLFAKKNGKDVIIVNGREIAL